jgi:hypothetical protein
MNYSYQALYDTFKKKKPAEYVQLIKEFWEKYGSSKSFDLSLEYINTHYNHCFPSAIDALFQSWTKNIELSKFLNHVDSIVSNLPIKSQKHLKTVLMEYSTISSFETINLKYKVNYKHDFSNKKECKKEFSNIFTTGFLDPNNQYNKSILIKYSHVINRDQCKFPKLEDPLLDKVECNVRKYLIQDLEDSWNHYLKSTSVGMNFNDAEKLIRACRQFLEFYSKGSQKLSFIISEWINETSKIQRLLITAELSPRFIPFNILSWLIGNIATNIKFSKSFLELFGCIAVLWSLEQWSFRCINIIMKGKSMEQFLLKELLENRPHENWSPRENTEWLVFEIEQNIMIRKIQINVAKAMIDPPDNENSVIQLNMGEGKTNVIVPLLISSLADGKTLVRVIALKSLFNMNYSSLKFKLGGVLNKRVYILRCQRDNYFDQEILSLYKSVYQECIENKGVVITLPEYLLSFKLKGLEIARSKVEKTELAKTFIETQYWLDNVKRDILDESDELLNSKYQLIYPVGNSNFLDSQRWLVAQAILNITRNYYTEYFENEDLAQVYPTLKVLDEKHFMSLRNRICVDILKGKASEISLIHLSKKQIEHVKKYVLDAEVDPESRKITKNIFEKNSTDRNILLILRNYFVYDVFKFIFTKQWKVDYGVNLRRKDLLQAVPYRAKDVPAERAQFAHPDITILLTQLTYYYTGLTDDQLDQVFDNLTKYSDASAEYQEWICSLPKNCNETVSKHHLRDFESINLNDSTQKIVLYSLLKYHTQVVNFWLCKFVFPKELKQFNTKLVSSAWDLCIKTRNPITGFSGTNESRLLLPLTVNYNELKELKGTNGMLLSYLLQKENDNYFRFQKDLKNKEMLQQISRNSSSIRVILDVGALMLELSNEQIVREWLILDHNIKAGVFFDSDDRPMVIDRQNYRCCLEISKYKDKLSDCFVYLDQFHTRGTDLKFPSGTIGAVTLGRGVTKDHLMQGCMRLRMLGHGHTVFFFASDEVHQQIAKRRDFENIHTIDILSWAIENSKNQIKDNFSNWAVNGLSSYRRDAIFQDYKRDLDLKNYTKKTTQQDLVDLIELYDDNRIDTNLISIIKDMDNAIQKILIKSSSLNFFKKNSAKIIHKLDEFVQNLKAFITSYFNEEQELEMEIEKHEEKEVEESPCAEPLENELELDVLRFVLEGEYNRNSKSFISLSNSLDESSLERLMHHKAWSDQVFTTKDFSKTVEKNDNTDSYLRQPRWLCYNQDLNVILIMSEYETNKLLPYVKGSKYNSIALLLPRCRKNQKRIISFSNIEIPSYLLEQISIYAGSLYFNSKEEEENFLSFISFCPSSNNPPYLSLINKNGYVGEKFKKTIFKNIKEENLSKLYSESDPSEMIIKLYELRNYGVIPKSSHHLEILLRGKKMY